MALGTDPSREEEAEIASGCFIGLCPPAVVADVAAVHGGSFGQVCVFAVAPGPFVVPDVEYRSRLRRRFGFYRRGVDLRAGGAAFSADEFRFLCRRLAILGGCGE